MFLFYLWTWVKWLAYDEYYQQPFSKTVTCSQGFIKSIIVQNQLLRKPKSKVIEIATKIKPYFAVCLTWYFACCWSKFGCNQTGESRNKTQYFGAAYLSHCRERSPNKLIGDNIAPSFYNMHDASCNRTCLINYNFANHVDWNDGALCFK